MNDVKSNGDNGVGYQLRLPILDEMISQPEYGKEMSNRERFELFHSLNPHVEVALANLSLQMKERGRKHWGIQAPYEILRYSPVIVRGDEPYKLNNTFCPFYSRLIMQDYPELDGFFFTREQKTA